MEPLPKRPRSENGGFGANPSTPELQHDRGGYQQGNGGANLECRHFNAPEGCSYGSNCRFRHISFDGRDVGRQSIASGGKPKPCMKFFSTSGCPFGESCHFLHYIPGGLSSLGLAPVVSVSATASATSHRKSAGPVGDPGTTVSGYKTKLCNRFNTAEGCRFGDKCHFAHGESDLRLSNQSRGSSGRVTSEGPMGVGPPGFINGNSEHSHLTVYGNISDFNPQGYIEPNPPGVAANDGSSNYSAGPIGSNVQVY